MQWRIQGVSLVSMETPFQIGINKIIYNHALINYVVKNIPTYLLQLEIARNHYFEVFKAQYT